MSEQTNNSFASSKEIRKLLHEIATEEDVNEYIIERVGGSMKGEGYMGIITSVKLFGKDKTNKAKTIHLVIKSASESKALRSQIAISTLFQREVYMYSAVFTVFHMMEMEKGLSLRPLSPKFYKAQLTDIPELLILENLKESGYKLHHAHIPMNDDHISLVMREYGRFHSLSFALRDQNPAKFQEIIGSIDSTFIKNMLRNSFVDNFTIQCVKAKKALHPQTDRAAIIAYEKFLSTIVFFFEELQEPIANYAVALHSDCWCNNMMFKYKDEENKPTDVRFFDFQLSIQGSPVLDLSYFFYTCSSKEMLNNLDHYLQLYYDSFSYNLRKLGSDPEKMFPYSVLQEHWKRYSKYGLIFSLLVIHLMLTKKEEVIDPANLSESGQSLTSMFDYEMSNFEQYKKRVRPIILHFVQNKFI